MSFLAEERGSALIGDDRLVIPPKIQYLAMKFVEQHLARLIIQLCVKSDNSQEQVMLAGIYLNMIS